MTYSLENEIQRIVANMDNEQHSQEQDVPETTDQEQQPDETIHIHYFPDAIVILKEDENTAQVVDSVPVIPQNISFIPAYAICVFYLFLIFSCIAFQVYEILNPPIATVTIIPKSQTVTLTGTLQLGRVLQPLTISQSQTVPTAGKGHQDAKQAQGAITFYNGLFISQTIAPGTILTGSDGIQVVTDQEADIPAANPPNLGQTTVTAHVIQTGVKGNISSFDINIACCLTAVKAVNTQSFSGGADERDFQTVAKKDIDSTATSLKTTLAQSVSGALQGQIQPPEQLFILPCTPTQTADHQPGQEATQVKVTVSETCSAVAYNSQKLERKATDLLNRQAATKVGTSYSLFGEVQVAVTQATATHTTTPLVFLSFHAQGTWVYAVSNPEQQRIKNLVRGRTKQEAIQILVSLSGIETASIEGVDDNQRLPKNPGVIRIVVFAKVGYTLTQSLRV